MTSRWRIGLIGLRPSRTCASVAYIPALRCQRRFSFRRLSSRLPETEGRSRRAPSCKEPGDHQRQTRLTVAGDLQYISTGLEVEIDHFADTGAVRSVTVCDRRSCGAAGYDIDPRRRAERDAIWMLFMEQVLAGCENGLRLPATNGRQEVHRHSPKSIGDRDSEPFPLKSNFENKPLYGADSEVPRTPRDRAASPLFRLYRVERFNDRPRSSIMFKPCLFSALATLALTLPALAQPRPAPLTASAGERVIDLALGDGVNQRVLFDAPARPRAILVMLPGGAGDVGVGRDGDLRHDDNFVVRTRTDWVARGYAVLIPDTIDGANLRGARSSPAYGRVVDELAAYARAQDAGPVFLIGTSQGTIATMNGAAQARPGLIAGIVLSESVSVPGRLSTETVFDAHPQDVRVPALLIANRDDACTVAPPSMAPRIAAAMTASPAVRVLMVSGGVQRSEKTCGSLSPHGYYGMESHVIGAIVEWLQAHGG